MGNSLSAVVGYIIIFYIKLQERVKEFIEKGKKKQMNYYNNDILLKDDEHRADILSREEIDKIIKTRNTHTTAEYKMIKNSIEMDEAECLNVRSDNKEIIDMHKELNMDEENDVEGESIEDLKSSIMNADEDLV
jgi:hypothetical protein